MLFADVVSIKEADCCEKCASFEYDLPCRIDKIILEELVLLFKTTEKLINVDNNKTNQ